ESNRSHRKSALPRSPSTDSRGSRICCETRSPDRSANPEEPADEARAVVEVAFVLRVGGTRLLDRLKLPAASLGDRVWSVALPGNDPRRGRIRARTACKIASSAWLSSRPNRSTHESARRIAGGFTGSILMGNKFRRARAAVHSVVHH